MQKTELVRMELFVGAFLFGLAFLPSSAVAQTPSPNNASRSATRPAHMPCKILERYGSSPKIENVYTLYYRRDGLLEKATHRIVTNDCRTLSACRYLPGESLDLVYKHDDLGRLIEVTAPVEKERMRVAYESGRPSRYYRTKEKDDAPVAEGEAIITIDSSGQPASIHERAWIATERGRRRTLTTARFSGTQEPFSSEPVVWPYAAESLYLGWTRRASTTSASGMRDNAYENELIQLDGEGRIRKEMSVVDYQGRTSVNREFVYDCADKIGSSSGPRP